MAKPGAPHDAMSEAFAKRLRQLYPEPADYSEGQVVESVGLKPDIYVRHPDDRQWAFEMVHRNSHAKHLRENHQRYSLAGIHDVWILWEDLEPRAGEPRPSDQGVLPPFLREQQNYQLTAPQRAILEMQDQETRYLYAFTVNTLGEELDVGYTPFIQATLTGVNIYRFENWNGQKRCSAQDVFVPMHEIAFEEDGSLTVPEMESYDHLLESLADQLGFAFDETGVIPTQAIAQFVQIPALLQNQGASLAPFIFASYMETLPPEQAREVLVFFRSVVAADLAPPADETAAMEIPRIFESPEAMAVVADALQELRQRLQRLGAPKPLLEFFEQWLDHRKLRRVAEWMQWQKESSALQETRAGRHLEELR